MRKGHFFATIVALVSGMMLFRKLQKSLRLSLENRTGETLDLFVGTKAAPDAMAIKEFLPGEIRILDLTNLPLLSHDAVYLRFPGDAHRDSYVRTLVYDVDESKDHMKAAVVDYGEGLYDIRIV